MPFTCSPDDGPRNVSAGKHVDGQTPEMVASAIEEFLAAHPQAAVLDDGRVIFDMRTAKYSLASEHGRCTLHLWSEDANLVRRVSAATVRNGSLRLATLRFGQMKP